MVGILTLTRCMHSKGSEGQLSTVLHAHQSHDPAVGQGCTDGLGSGHQPCGNELQLFLWHFLTLILKLLEKKKRVYQQRAAVVCSHRVLIGKSLRDTYCCYLVLIRWKMPQLRGDRKCWAKGMCVWLQRNALLSDNSEIWQSCLTRNLFTMTEIKKEEFRLNGLGSRYDLAIA